VVEQDISADVETEQLPRHAECDVALQFRPRGAEHTHVKRTGAIERGLVQA
jgi:hypothetical protein